MRFYVEKCEAMRNFANKIWNASRYVLMNLTIGEPGLPAMEDLEQEDKWVLSKLNTLIREVTANLDAYEIGVASSKVYDFIWDTYCDWYIELTKTRLYSENEKSKLAAQKVLVYVLDADAPASAPVHAVHHRGDLAGDSPRRQVPDFR